MAESTDRYEEDIRLEVEPEDLEHVKDALLYVLLRMTDIDMDDAYTLVYRQSGRIVWH